MCLLSQVHWCSIGRQIVIIETHQNCVLMVLVLSDLGGTILTLFLLLIIYLMREVLKDGGYYFYFFLFFALRSFLILSINFCADYLNLLLRILNNDWLHARLLCAPPRLYSVGRLQRRQAFLGGELKRQLLFVIGGTFGSLQ